MPIKFFTPFALFLIMASLFVGCTNSRQVASTQKTAQKTAQPRKFRTGAAKQTGFQEALQQEIDKTIDPALGVVPQARLLKAQGYANELRLQTAANKGSDKNQTLATINGIIWDERGPNNVGGRVRALMIDKNDATNKTVWAAGVGGGLWKTTDITAAAPNWTTQGDFFSAMAVTCVAQDPTTPNTMYFGTGEGWGNADAIRGDGIWKTTDGGLTWTQLASTDASVTTDFTLVSKIVVDAAGKIYAATQNGGLQRSTNGGTTWTKVIGASTSGGVSNIAADVEIGADNDVYVSFGRIFNTGAVYKSDNATYGANTGNIGNWSDITPIGGGTFERIEIVLSPSDASKMYLLTQAASLQSAGNIFYSNDAGGNVAPTWANRGIPQFCDQTAMAEFTRGQAWYDLIGAVHPTDPNTLYIGGVDILKTTDAGVTFNNVTVWSGYTNSAGSACGFSAAPKPVVHADQHAILFVGGTANTMLFGNDGGVFYGTNMTTTPSIISKSANLNITQYYACAINPTSGSNEFLAGAQDNGTQRFSQAGIGTSTSVSGGDGAVCHIDQDNPLIQISSYTNNNYYVTTNGWATKNTYSTSGGSFINPTDYDSANDLLYGGNTAGTYIRMTIAGVFTTVTVTAFGTGKVTHVMVSPNTPTTVYFGLNNGNIVKIVNANTATGTVAGELVRTVNAVRSISCLAIETGNEAHQLATYSNYGVISIFETINGTAATPTWTSIEGNLPDMPVRWAMFAPDSNDNVLLATELGVWTTDNINGASTVWAPSLSPSALANTRIDMLQLRTSDSLIAAASHGRGLFTTPKYTLFNKMSFATSAQTVNESDAITGADCRKYKDISIPVTLIRPVNDADAVITLSANAASTAVATVDYTILTPTFTFLRYGTKKENATVRIYNNDIVDGNRTLVLNITETSADIKATIIGTHTLTIRNNDNTPQTAIVTLAAGQTVFSENFDAITSGTIGTWTQTSIPAVSPACVWTVGSNGGTGFTNKSMYISTAPASQSYAYNTSVSCVNTLYSPTINASNYTNLQVSVKYKSNGEIFGGIYYDFGKIAYSIDGGASYTFLTTQLQGITTATTLNLTLPAAANNASNLKLIFYWENDDSAGGQLPFGIDDFVLTGTGNAYSPTPVQTALNAATADEQYLGPNQTVHFYDNTTGNVLATIQNNSAHDFGCTKVEIDRAGTGVSQFWNNTPSEYIATKSFKVTPTNNNAAASHTTTLYYTQAEIDGWIAATGKTLADFKLLKIANASIADVTPSNTHSSDVAIGTTQNHAMYKTTDHAFTATFTGFSGFGGGVAGSPLPVSWLAFDGFYKNNAVELEWKTATELNNKGFEVERSLDGAKFESIGFVQGNGTTNEAHTYTFEDTKPFPITYYRLRQMDFDGKTEYSKTIVVKSKNAQNGIVFYPNPARNELNIQSDLPTTLKIIDAVGRLVQTVSIEIGTQTINISALPAGVYYLHDARGNVKEFVKL